MGIFKKDHFGFCKDHRLGVRGDETKTVVIIQVKYVFGLDQREREWRDEDILRVYQQYEGLDVVYERIREIMDKLERRNFHELRLLVEMLEKG